MDGAGSYRIDERLPPHDVQAEQCLIASMMLDKDAIGRVAPLLQGGAFYSGDHQIIFAVLVEMYLQNKPVDAVLLREELSRRGTLAEVGGTEYLAQLLNSVPSAAHADHYAEIVHQKALLRELISASQETIREAYAPHEKAEHVLLGATKRVFAVAESRGRGKMVEVGSIASEVYEMLHDNGRRGVSTGFYDLDNLLNGLQSGEMIVLAARPSMGKTAFAMNIIENVARNPDPADRKACAVFSLEMSSHQLTQRLLCSMTGIDGQRVRKGMMSSEEYVLMAKAVSELASTKIFIDDTSGLTIVELASKARQLKTTQDIGLVMIDYLQLMDNPGVESRQQQISEISRGIKALARELKVPVICLSQLNRSSEQRDGHRPRMSDLRESGAIEQDADVIMLLHREDYYKQGQSDFQPTDEAEVIIAKQRNGPTDTVKLLFDRNTTRFKNLAGVVGG